MGLLDGFLSIARNINKVTDKSAQDTTEGIVSDLLPELKLEMKDEELISLKKKWIAAYEPYEKEIAKKQEENENYWLGKQFEGVKSSRALVDNLIFEAQETFLPIATRQNPEPLVSADNSEEGNKLSGDVQKMLVYLSDSLRLKLRLKRVVRNWSIYFLGIAKVGWSLKKNEVSLIVLRPKKIILDPNATINDDMEYTGSYIGEYREDIASDLIQRFPSAKDFIEAEVKDKLGTKLVYIEWWTEDYLFWTLKNEVLGKAKNPHWNYDQTQPITNETGQTTDATVPGKNHFATRKMPYIFLSVFNLGLHPHDDTNLISQNLAVQDLINKRLKQIDKNADNTNGGWAISGERSGLNKEQAAQAIQAFQKGNGVWVPQGDVNSAVSRMTGQELPSFVYQSLLDYRNELRNIFGTRGSTPQGTVNEPTVRGKIIVKGQDTDRIGNGIGDYIEQFADQVFNWFVQLMYVYYDEVHTASVLGKEKAQEYIQLSAGDLSKVKLTVSVKEGSLIPKDDLTKSNQAVDLASAGLLDPITLFDRLGFPNPREAALRLFQWKADPMSLFPELQQAQQAAQAQQQQQPPPPQPKESINFKDVPPEAQTQMLAQAGIQIHPATLAAHNASQTGGPMPNG